MRKSALLLLSFFFALPAAAQDHPGSLADLVEKLSPAVVNISTTQKVKAMQNTMAVPGMPPEMDPLRDFFQRFGQPQGEHEAYSLGSGFLIDASGYIITNNHVVKDATEVSVTLSDKSRYKAKIIGTDTKTDLALLKVEAKKDLPFVTLGDSDALRVGDWVIAIGNPFGLGGTVTQGIISARQRSINAGPFDDFLQTDAPINQGNSGGPLFNMDGKVIGINSAIFSNSGGSVGIGFAIPTALAKPVVAQLKEYGRTHRGWLGVKIQDVNEDIADSLGMKKSGGALVLDVTKDGPADKAGLKAGDVITGFDGKEITEMRHLPRLVAETKIGKAVDLTYWRNSAAKTVSMTIGELDESKEAAKPADDDQDSGTAAKSGSETVAGMEVAALSPQLRAQLRLDARLSGLVVRSAKAEAARRGISSGDVIEAINNEPVKTVAELRKAFEDARKAGHKFALAKIAHRNEEAFIALPTAEENKTKE